MSNSMDPETLEREADAQRARLSNTLNAVEQRFSPNQLVQQTVDYFGQHGGDIAESVGRSVKANPLALMLTGVGIAWLMSSQSRAANSRDGGYGYRDSTRPWDSDYLPAQRRSAYTQNAMSVTGGNYGGSRPAAGYNTDAYEYEGDDDSMLDDARDAANRFGRTVSQWREQLMSNLQSVKQEAGESAEQWRDRIVAASVEQGERFDQRYRDISHSSTQWRNDLQSRLLSVKQDTEETADQWRQRIVDTSAEQAEVLDLQYRRTKNQLVRHGRQSAQSAKDFMHEQPLVAGALGVAAGAVLGALLPRSSMEDELFGSRADSIKNSLARQAESVGTDAAATVADSAQTLRAKAERKLNSANSDLSTPESA